MCDDNLKNISATDALLLLLSMRENAKVIKVIESKDVAVVSSRPIRIPYFLQEKK